MKARTVALIAMILIAGTAWASDERVIEQRVDVSGIERVKIDAAVGDISVTAGSGSELRVAVELEPKTGGFLFFGSASEGRKQVDQAELEVERAGKELRLSITGPHEGRKFEEDWEVVIPADLHLDIDAGVGDLEISGLEGNLVVDLGVGDVEVSSFGGNVSVDNGVGDVVIRGSHVAVGAVSADTGVGDCNLRLPDDRVAGEGMVAHSLSWRGDGKAKLTVDNGVGDIRILLE